MICTSVPSSTEGGADRVVSAPNSLIMAGKGFILGHKDRQRFLLTV